MSFAAGESIKQTVHKDNNSPRLWDCAGTKIVNVQVLNAAHFEELTRMAAPPTPVNMQIYAQSGLPFFDIYIEKPSNVHGDFEKVKTVAEMDDMLGVEAPSDAPYDANYRSSRATPQKCRCRKKLGRLRVSSTRAEDFLDLQAADTQRGIHQPSTNA
jgi:hypothetical protein